MRRRGGWPGPAWCRSLIGFGRQHVPAREARQRAGAASRGRAHPDGRVAPGRRSMRWVRLIVYALVTALAAAPSARAEALVRWITPEPLLTWDPHGSDRHYSLLGIRHVYEGLTRLTSDLRLE